MNYGRISKKNLDRLILTKQKEKDDEDEKRKGDLSEMSIESNFYEESSSSTHSPQNKS